MHWIKFQIKISSLIYIVIDFRVFEGRPWPVLGFECAFHFFSRELTLNMITKILPVTIIVYFLTYF